MMKTIAVLFAPSWSRHIFDARFDGESAFDMALKWAKAVPSCVRAFVFCDSSIEGKCAEAAARDFPGAVVLPRASWTLLDFLDELSARAKGEGADAAVFSLADCPFLDGALTREVVSTHFDCSAEYTFADGYPSGFAPEALDSGCAAILAEIARGARKELGEAPFSRDGVAGLVKADINSFDVETVLASEDWRLWRFSFNCESKSGLLSCEALFEKSRDIARSAEPLARLAAESDIVARTVPGFYEIELTGDENSHPIYLPPKRARGGRMPLALFKKLAPQMRALSEKAVVGFSAFGEPLLHPDFAEFVETAAREEGLSIFVETDGLGVTEELCEKIKKIDNVQIIWIVALDAASEEMYRKIRGGGGTLKAAADGAAALQRHFPGKVWAQMTRTKINEEELEAFYKYWSAGESPTRGKVVIQKYNSFCATLPDERSADLSPIERNPCWHARRDMVIMANGDVPICRSRFFGAPAGNANEKSLEEIWRGMDDFFARDMKGERDELCGKCDEYYTFNF